MSQASEHLRVPVPADEVERFAARRTTIVEIDPDGLYDSLETAILLGYGGSEKNRRSQVSAIPTDELVRTPTGPRGGVIRFQGRDIVSYITMRREKRVTRNGRNGS